MKCIRCGFDPEAKVIASWSFVLAHEIQSLNKRGTNRGAWAVRNAYKADRDMAQWLVKEKRLALRIPKATSQRRLTLTRFYGPSGRQYDIQNLVGGGKALVDAFVREGLLVDDRPEFAEIHHLQERALRGAIGVLLEEISR